MGRTGTGEGAAWALGLAGLLPFVAGAGVFAYGPPRYAGPGLLAVLSYGAVILSFLGGIRWGAEIAGRAPRALLLLLSVVPSLVAWGLLAAPGLDPAWQIGGFIAAFVAVWVWDARWQGAPEWWGRLRTVLTIGVCASLAVALEAALDLMGG